LPMPSFGKPFQEKVLRRLMQSFSTRFISRVTTPAPLGAFFRNGEGRGIFPSFPRMEEGTQGVTPPFNEEVAWGPGWFPSPL
jgi:hypothetical protein